MARLRFRYSLRLLLAVTFLSACAMVWLSVPTQKAHQFVDAINAKDYERANGLCAAGSVTFPGHRGKDPGFDPIARVSDLAWEDLWKGRRKVYVNISHWSDGGFSGSGMECIATRRGIQPGLEFP